MAKINTSATGHGNKQNITVAVFRFNTMHFPTLPPQTKST